MLFLFTCNGLRVSDFRDWKWNSVEHETPPAACRGRAVSQGTGTSVWETSECNNRAYYCGHTGVCICNCNCICICVVQGEHWEEVWLGISEECTLDDPTDPAVLGAGCWHGLQVVPMPLPI